LNYLITDSRATVVIEFMTSPDSFIKFFIFSGFIGFFLSLHSTSSAQINTDTLKTELHSPARAAIYSAILPGLGQAYNRKSWKIPVIYAGFAGLGYAIDFNQKKYTIYRQAFVYRLDGDSTTTDNFVGKYSDDNLRVLKDYYRKNRDLSVIGTVLLYAMNIIDAHVDAHLFDFDVSDNLSLRLAPGNYWDNKTLVAFRLDLKFR
jgi:hypothetical protein